MGYSIWGTCGRQDTDGRQSWRTSWSWDKALRRLWRGCQTAEYFEVYVELDNWSTERKITREGTGDHWGRGSSWIRLEACTDWTRKGKRETEGGGVIRRAASSAWRVVKKEAAMGYKRQTRIPSWRQSWSTFTLTLMFPESHSPAGSWFRISRSASVWAQAGNKQRSRVWTQELWKEWSPWGRAELCSHIWGAPVLGRLQMTLWRRETTRHYQAAASSDHPSIHTNLVCCFRDPGEKGSTWTEGWWPT